MRTSLSEAETGDQPATSSEDAALAEARKLGRNVEVTSLRGERRDVFATPGGTLEAREYLQPVRTRVGGEWRSVDTTLVKSASGPVTPRAAAVGLEFSGGGGGPLVTLERAGRELELSWPDPVPAPVLEGDTATYVNLLPEVDLKLAAQSEGFTQLLVVKTEAAAKNPQLSELRMRLAAQGLTVAETSAGGLQATDKGSGGVVFEAPTPQMWDSSDGRQQAAASTLTGAKQLSAPESIAAVEAPGAGEDPGPTESGQLAPVGVEVTADAGELVLTPDAEVLSGANTVYPVYIDPQWYTPKATGWTMASKYWADSPQWKFNGKSDEGLGYCYWYYCKPYDTKRLFYQLPVTAFAGKTVLSAEFVVRNTWSASCDARSVELWRTKGISSSTTWNSQLASGFWADHLTTQSFAHGYEGCSAKDAEFNVKSAVQQAADHRWSTITFGMQAANESDAYGWKRFADDAYLRVQYNRPPSQIKMGQLVQDPGGFCADPDTPRRVRTRPTLRANDVKDPDGDRVSVQFRANWDTGDGKGFVPRWTSARTTDKASGSDFSMGMPTSTPTNKKIGWYARSWDGAQWSPWSWEGSATTCGMVYDTTVGPGPSVTSPQYPAVNDSDPDDPWVDGVGRYGSFTIDAPATDVTRYAYTLNDDPSTTRTVSTSNGAARTVKVMPSKHGTNTLVATAYDAAGNAGESKPYLFRVRAGQPDRLSWQLDEPGGAAKVGGEGGSWPADLSGGTTTGAEGVTGTGLGLDGVNGHGATESPVLNTGKSFSVSLWAKLPAADSGTATVALAQGGHNTSGFEIYHSPSLGGWSFLRHTSDAASGATAVRASQPACPAGDTACADGRRNKWTHLVGVFDNPNQKLQLYVDGRLVGSAPFTTPWDARGATVLGAASHYGTKGNFFAGNLDEVQLFDYQLTADQVTRLSNKTPVETNRPAKLVWPLDESVNATQVIGRAQKVEADVQGGAQTGVTGLADKAMKLDGADDHARTTRPVMDTFQSFAVSAWVRLPSDKENKAMTAVAQSSGPQRGFELYHSSSMGGWVFLRPSADTTDATLVRARQNACPPETPNCTAAGLGSWTHVVGVYDLDAQEIRLYVNGKLEDEQPFTTPWLATGPVTLGAALTPTGAAGHLKGDVDDVRMYDRTISFDEVLKLYEKRPALTGRWTFDTSTGTATPDAHAPRNDMTLHGGALTDTAKGVDGALVLDGIDDHATTAAKPFDTSGSFTVTAQVRTSGPPQKPVSLMSVPGTRKSAFELWYEPSLNPEDGPGQWVVTTAGGDDDGAVVARAENHQFDPWDWNHVGLVYDNTRRQLLLYVNGLLEPFVCRENDDGTLVDPTCTNEVPWTYNAPSYSSERPMRVGGSGAAGTAYWPGEVSDLWTFQGALSASQVRELASWTRDRATQVPTGN